MRKVLYILSLLVLSLSCSRHNDAETFLEKAQSVIETKPDTAAMYLDSILMPEKFLKKDRYMEYLVTKVQAKYKNYDNIKEDTNIFITKTYFDKTRKNSQMNMYAHLYSACVYDERGEYENAMKDYKTAFTLAENMHDSLYMWRINNYIGNVFNQLSYFEEELEIYKESINLVKDIDKKARSFANIASRYCVLSNNDSAQFYIKQAIAFAEQTNDDNILSQIYQNAHVVYSECGEHELARKYLNMSFEKNSDPQQDNLYYLNYFHLYLSECDINSAKTYLNKLKSVYDTIDNLKLKANICDAFTTYYVSVDMLDSALYYQKNITYIFNDIN